MKFTVVGARGFIGSHVSETVERTGHDCFRPARGDPALFTTALGHVVYCAGLTADFRTRVRETIEAHVVLLAELLGKANFESLLFLSSTRVYAGAATGDEEGSLVVRPNRRDDLYNLTKLTGEALCLQHPNPAVRVVRLSNVCGYDGTSENFLPSVLRSACFSGSVTLRTPPNSAKDYVGIDDVASVLPRIAVAGSHRLYNVASGVSTSNQELMAEVARLTGCRVSYGVDTEIVSFPRISIDRVRKEFDFRPKPLAQLLPALVRAFQESERHV